MATELLGSCSGPGISQVHGQSQRQGPQTASQTSRQGGPAGLPRGWPHAQLCKQDRDLSGWKQLWEYVRRPRSLDAPGRYSHG